MQGTSLRALHALGAGCNGLTSRSLEALARAFEAGCLPELQALCLANNDFADEQSSRALAQAAPHLSALRTLHLARCKVGTAMLAALAGAALPALSTLLLDANDEEIDDDGLKVCKVYVRSNRVVGLYFSKRRYLQAPLFTPQPRRSSPARRGQNSCGR